MSSRSPRRLHGLFSLIPFLIFGVSLWGQSDKPTQDSPAPPPAKQQPGQLADTSLDPVDKRVAGIIPNYRTANAQAPFHPITTKAKFTIAFKDSVDYPVYFTTAFFAGVSAFQGSDDEVYGGGVKGFAHRVGISYVDQVVGNFFPEAIAPTLFHLDPRYFRKGTGTVKSRLWYAVNRIFVCRNDHGNLSFNANELVGNTMAASVAMTYHVHERTAGDAAYQFSNYVESDMVGQVIKEFWPDIKRWSQNRHHRDVAQNDLAR
jgi:hypothetical protein